MVFAIGLFVFFCCVFSLSLLACLVGFSVFFALALVTTYNMAYNMSCGVSYVFVGFFSSREGRMSWIFFYGVSQRHGFSVVVGNCLVFVVVCLGLLGFLPSEASLFGWFFCVFCCGGFHDILYVVCFVLVFRGIFFFSGVSLVVDFFLRSWLDICFCVWLDFVHGG